MGYFVLAAGGTGGHIHSAIALGERFESLGHRVCYFSGDRYLDFQLLKDYRTVHLEAASLKGKGPLRVFSSILQNIKALKRAYSYFKKERPYAVIGVGGYIGGPVLMAAFFLKIPIFILEQNGILGLTNRFLSYFVKKIFVHFRETKGISFFLKGKVVVSGNPIRASFFHHTFTPIPDNRFLKVVVFGGSLGAKTINDMVASFVKLEPRFSMHIIHQVGKLFDEVPSPHPLVTYEKREFLDNIVTEYQWSDLIICRAGASTISELRVVGHPVILIPYPFHKDRQQFYNAEFLKKEVDFPVYVKTVEELSVNNFDQLKDILRDIWNRKLSLINNQWSHRLDHSDATSIIVEEMVKYVHP